jgi:hypothetical protein
MFCLNGGAVSWKSSKQDTVTDLMMDAKYILLLQKLQRKLFGLEILFMNWLLFLVHPVTCITIATIVEP